jgi:DNA-binding CsgD family transcriptional regulator
MPSNALKNVIVFPTHTGDTLDEAGPTDRKCAGCPECRLAREKYEEVCQLFAWGEAAASHFARLTRRQREIMELVVAGHHNKIIAADLGISQRTVENHRAEIMRKSGVKSVPELAQLAFAAAWCGIAESRLRPLRLS